MNTTTNQTKAYIILNDKVIAEITTDLENGQSILVSEYADVYTHEHDNNKYFTVLKNAEIAKISRDEKYNTHLNRYDENFFSYAERENDINHMPQFHLSQY